MLEDSPVTVMVTFVARTIDVRMRTVETRMKALAGRCRELPPVLDPTRARRPR